MDLENVNKVFELLKMKSNVENILNFMDKNRDCSVSISAKTENGEKRYVFLDEEGKENATDMLDEMLSRIKNDLEEM